MDWIIWLIVIVVIVAVVWWLLNRNNSRGKSGSAGTGTAPTHDSTHPHPHDAVHGASHRGALSGGGSAASASAAGLARMPKAGGFSQAEPDVEPEPEPDPIATAEDAAAAEAHAAARAAARAQSGAQQGAPSGTAAGAAAGAEAAPAAEGPEWETQWSETPPAATHTVPLQEPGLGTPGDHGDHVMEAPAAGAAAGGPAPAAIPVHHPEYTAPHSPTLPGAESAAAEAETAQTAASSAASETAASHSPEPAGHLAVDQPYGEGSASPAADGSGPEGFAVKGNASSMIYHDETSTAFEETTAEVWFLSPAHAEAAGFRPPRRSRQ